MQRTEEIKGIIGTLRDLKDDARTHQNQIAYLLYTNVEKQRAESATKILVKNFWKYSETSDILTQQQHREAIIQWIAKRSWSHGGSDQQVHVRPQERPQTDQPVHHDCQEGLYT